MTRDSEPVDRFVERLPNSVTAVGHAALSTDPEIDLTQGVSREDYIEYLNILNGGAVSPALEVRTARIAWMNLETGYEAVQDIDAGMAHNVAPSTLQQINRRCWELSGIKVTNQYPYEIELGSLVASMRSGAIRFALYGKESHFTAIADFLHYRGIDVVPPEETDLNHPDIEAIRTSRRILENIFIEAESQKFDGRYIRGPFSQQYSAIADSSNVQLRAIDQKLSPLALGDSNYYDLETKYMVNRLDIPKRQTLRALQKDKIVSSKQVHDETWHIQHNQIIPVGTLDEPEYLKQEKKVFCANAAFRMVFEAITGDRLSEPDVKSAALTAYGDKLLIDEEYLKVFSTPTFKERYGASVRVIQFAAMDLATISKLASGIKERSPKAKVFTVVGLQSTSEVTKQHRAVLLSADAESVTYHDPIPEEGAASMQTSKEEFCARWAAVQNTGYMVIAA